MDREKIILPLKQEFRGLTWLKNNNKILSVKAIKGADFYAKYNLICPRWIMINIFLCNIINL